MPHQNSVFHTVTKHLPWAVFDGLVAQHGADARVRRLRSKDHLMAMLYGQLAGAQSIREITGAMQSHAARLYHLGTRPVARSTLADANAHRSSAVFAGLFAAMVQRGGRRTRRAIGEAVHLIDSTRFSLSVMRSQWARFSADTCCAKLHLVLDPHADQPVHAAITPGNVNDITVAQTMPIAPGMTYVFDLGYYDFGWWAKLDAAGCRIVTRLKSNTPFTAVTDLPVPPGGPILSDRIGHLPERLARSRRNPFQHPIREILLRIETGKILRIMSNDLAATAQDIADLYKRRWAIELFFRWVKQTLRISHFLGTSENAVRIQITVALIAYMLLRLAQATQTTVESPLAFARLVRANLMHRRSIGTLAKARAPTLSHTQMALL